MKHFRVRVIVTVLLAIALIIVFGWIVAWQNYSKLSRDLSEEKHLTREAVNDTLHNLSDAWTDYEQRVIRRYEVEALFSSLALQSVIEEGEVPEADGENGAVISIRDGKVSSLSPAADALGLDASMFKSSKGSFAAPKQPSTYVAYSRIGNTPSYYIKWYEDTVIEEIVREAVSIPGVLKWTEITYGVPAMFVSTDPESGAISEILYENDRYFSDCGSLADLGLSAEDLGKNHAEASGSIVLNDAVFSYVSGKSDLPAGYVILFEPVPDLFAKAFIQAGYMIAALVILIVTLLAAGFSLYPFVRNNILTPEEEKTYLPSHVRSVASLFGAFGLLIIVCLGMFSCALNIMYDDVIRGRERLAMLDDSTSIYAERHDRGMQTFHEVYLDFGNLIAGYLDKYPQLRDQEVLKEIADSISASSITLYDGRGRETVSSGPWKALMLSTDPDSFTYDFRRITKGVPSIVHDPEIDEVTGLNEMRLGFRILDDTSDGQYGVMIISVDIPSLTNHDIDPERSIRQILASLSDSETNFCIIDADTGKVAISSTGKLEGEDFSDLGLGESDMKSGLISALKTEDGDYLVTSLSLKAPEVLSFAGVSGEAIAFYKGPKTSYLFEMVTRALLGGLLYLAIYSFLAWMVLSGYTDEFFQTYKHVKGAADPKKKLNPLRKALAASTPTKNGLAAMELMSAIFLVQFFGIMSTNSFTVRNTVYRYISTNDWGKGFNLFAVAAILALVSKVILTVIGIRLVMRIFASFSGSKGKTAFRLIANVSAYIALVFSLIKILEYLGFSPAAIAASMGSLALAVSLGAQNFISDIFAGLTMVFEGTLHVGDNVVLSVFGASDCHGTIEEVGLRSIKVLTREGDLLTCCNKDVRVIRNCTQLSSRVICEFDLSSEYPADSVKAMLEAELPGVGQTDRRILSGPVYNGILKIGNGTMTLSVSAECSEEDCDYVRDRLYTSLQQIFRKHGYTDRF